MKIWNLKIESQKNSEKNFFLFFFKSETFLVRAASIYNFYVLSIELQIPL